MQILEWNNLTGVHCGSSAIRNVINFFGVDYPEEICFGIGCGLGFFYNKLTKSKPSEVIHLRAPNMEPIFFSHQNKKNLKWISESNGRIAKNKLISELKRNHPVFLQTDLYYLKYYNSNIHFPGHVVVCVGYNTEHDSFYLSDTNFKELQIVSSNDLSLARSSKAEPYPLSYNWFSVKSFKPFKNLKKQLEISVKLNSENFINGQNSLRGTSSIFSILDWIGNFDKWSDYKDSANIFKFAYQIIVKRGSKGSGFRCIYSDFLKLAQDESKKIYDLKLYSKMSNISDIWKDIGYGLKNLSKNYKKNDMKKVLNNIKNVYIEELEYHMFIKDNL